MKLSTINVKTTKIINAMKKIVGLFITTIMSCVLYAQIYEYEWQDVTPKYADLIVKQSAITKGGRIVVATAGWISETSDTCKTWNVAYDFQYNDKYIYDEFTPRFFKMATDSLHGFFYATYSKDDVSSNALLFTNDGGKSWQEAHLNLSGENIIIDAAWKDGETMYASVFDTTEKLLYMYKTDNVGTKWEKITDNLLFRTLNYDTPKTYMAFVNEQLGYMFTWGGYYVTTDGGVSWIRNVLEIWPTFLFQFNNGKILLTVSSPINKALKGCTITNFPYSNNSYATPKVLYDLGNGKVYGDISGSTYGSVLSLDSLQTWEKTTDDYSKLDILKYGMSQNLYYGNVETRGVYVKSEKECFVIGRQKGRLFHTLDGGNTWTYKDFNTTLYEIQIFSDEIIYMTGNDSLFISHDGGISWIGKVMKIYNLSGSKDRHIHFSTEDFGYVYDDTELYQTQNGGDTWNLIQNISWTFYEYGATLNGAFANEKLGLFRSDDSKTILMANIDPEKSTMTVSVVSEAIQGNGSHNIYIDYIDNKWLLWDWWRGYIYTCDKDLHFTMVSEPLNYAGGNKYSERILNYGNGKLLLPILSENTLYPVDSAMYSEDGGDSWDKVPFTMPNHLYINKSDNPNVVYTCKYDYNLSIYKGIHKVRTLDSSFEKQENGTIQCSISNADNQNYTAKVVLEQVNGTSIVVQDNVEIKSGESFVIALPQNITANYVIKVVPYDEEVYEMVQSQEFIVNNGGSAIDAVSAEDIQIRVVNGRIECDCEDYTIYNVAGQKVQNNALPSGTYFVHCGTQVKKVVVQ